MDAAYDLADRRVRTAFGFHRAQAAISLTGSVDNRVSFGDVGTRPHERTPLTAQGMALRTAVFIALLVPVEGVAGQRAVGALVPLPHWDVRFDVLLVDHPAQQ